MEAMTFQPIKNVRLTDEVTRRLEECILDGTFSDGDMLPSESELSQQLGVGRRAVREALRILEMKGLVQVQVGVGTIVRRNDLDSYLKALTRNVRSYLAINRADIEHVMELRWLLEGAALDRLLEASDRAAIEGLAESVKMQRRAYDDYDARAYQDWHFRFHCMIVSAINNPIVDMIYRQVLTLVYRPMEHAGAHREIQASAIKDHEAMLAAVQRGDRDDLRAILNRHLETFLTNLNRPGVGLTDEEKA